MIKARSNSVIAAVHAIIDGYAVCNRSYSAEFWTPTDDAVNCLNCWQVVMFQRLWSHDVRVAEMELAFEHQLEWMRRAA